MRGLRCHAPGQEDLGETIYCKRFQQDSFVVLACADEELIGRTLEEGKISFKVGAGFYRGKKVSAKELKRLLKEANNINLIGEGPVKAALEEGYLKEEDLIRIEGVPHAQIVKV